MFGKEPALWMGAINAILALGVGFGLPLDSTKVGLINATVAALLGLYTRSRVSPVAPQPASQPERA